MRYPIFLALLEYLYTDSVAVELDIAMVLFQVSKVAGSRPQSSGWAGPCLGATGV